MTNWTARIACVYALCVLLHAPAALSNPVPDAGEQDAAAKEAAQWEQAIQDALQLLSQRADEPESKTFRPQQLEGVDDPTPPPPEVTSYTSRDTLWFRWIKTTTTPPSKPLPPAGHDR